MSRIMFQTTRYPSPTEVLHGSSWNVVDESGVMLRQEESNSTIYLEREQTPHINYNGDDQYSFYNTQQEEEEEEGEDDDDLRESTSYNEISNIFKGIVKEEGGSLMDKMVSHPLFRMVVLELRQASQAGAPQLFDKGTKAWYADGPDECRKLYSELPEPINEMGEDESLDAFMLEYISTLRSHVSQQECLTREVDIYYTDIIKRLKTNFQPFDIEKTSHIKREADRNTLEESPLKKKRTKTPLVAQEILEKWTKAHMERPYPDEKEKNYLATETGLSLSQVSNWFVNARRRRLPKWRAEMERTKELQKVLRSLMGGVASYLPPSSNNTFTTSTPVSTCISYPQIRLIPPTTETISTKKIIQKYSNKEVISTSPTIISGYPHNTTHNNTISYEREQIYTKDSDNMHPNEEMFTHIVGLT